MTKGGGGMRTMWIAIVLIVVAVALLVFAVKWNDKVERMKTPWMHPPDDDDGCSVMEEVDPDGKNTR